jgi:protein-disulfide isomerase
MKKTVLAISVLIFASAVPYARAQSPHPWLDAQEKKQRFGIGWAKSPHRGPVGAPVIIIEFTDYECPYCAKQEPTIKKVLEAYPTQVMVVVKNLPLVEVHPKAKQKALVAECMGLQGKFWQAHDRFLAGAPAKMVTEGADQGKLKACIAKGGEGLVAADLADAKRLGMASTPSFVIDGIRIGEGEMGFGRFKLLIDAELARKGGSK